VKGVWIHGTAAADTAADDDDERLLLLFWLLFWLPLLNTYESTNVNVHRFPSAHYYR
jgi:hypothetical protein